MALGVDFAAEPALSRCAYDNSPVRMHLYPPPYHRIRCRRWSCCRLNHHHTIQSFEYRDSMRVMLWGPMPENDARHRFSRTIFYRYRCCAAQGTHGLALGFVQLERR
jgi:hypothetical protein